MNLIGEGKSFAVIIELNDVKCNVFNGQAFEDGYVSLDERWKLEVEKLGNLI